MKLRSGFIFIFLIILAGIAKTQPSGEPPSFAPPVDFRMLLSGTFGELRTNHFHSGIDIKTNGRTGENIYAIADGYVSRIKVSPFGFGKTLYITHPGGYVSVYAHLDRFNPELSEYTKNEQYRRKSYSVDFFPEVNELPVKKREVIGFSGNSGSSLGPHLHFEIREERTQKPLNPLMFGFEVKDYIRPKIRRLKIYPVGDHSLVNGQPDPINYSIEGWGEVHRLPDDARVRVTGEIAFGVDAYDLLNDASNKNGVYSVSVVVDGEEVFLSEMSSFSFSESRYINSLIDYEEFVSKKVRYQRTEVDPNNKLSIYKVKKRDGRYLFNEERAYEVVITIRDLAGNTSKLSFTVEGVSAGSSKFAGVGPATEGIPFRYESENVYEAPGIRFRAPEGAFYRTFVFTRSSEPAREGIYSDIYTLHDEVVPIHQYCELEIEPLNLPEQYESKSLIGMIDKDGNISSAGGTFENGVVRTRIREFGSYCVIVDSIAPEILPRNPRKFDHLTGQTSISFIIRDELSGIGNYEATMNGEWLLMEYDAKNDLLIYHIDERLLLGANNFILRVEDQKGNESIFESTLIRK